MKGCYLEVTYRKGRPLAAYLYLPGYHETDCKKTELVTEGIVVDFGLDRQPIGIEIITPEHTTAAQVNAVLQGLHLPPMDPSELRPLRAA